MARRFHRGLLLGTSLIALAALAQAPAWAQDLTNPSGSTVAPGFIKVDPGETFDNVFNFGTITGSGALGAGIEVEGTGAVLGDVRNRGSGIIALTGATATGILVDGTGVSIGDDVDNFGLIEIDTTVLGYGIKVGGKGQFIGGDVANRGEGVIDVSVVSSDSETGVQSATATASDVSAYGIYVVAGVTGIDDVANFGVMHVEAISSANAVASDTTFAFASASLTGSAFAIGISLDVTSIAGAVINAGFLEVDAVAHAAAIAVATGPGASASLGADNVTATANAIGIEVEVTTLTGGFANVGIIDADAVAETIDHAVANATTGDANAFIAIGDTITRSANATATGVYIHGATTVGGILTLGPINDAAQALVDIELTANAATGNAHAYIDGTEGIYLTAEANAYGLYVSDIGTIEEGVFLAGDISISASAVVDVDLLASGAGSASAYIFDSESTIAFSASASASGVVFTSIGVVDGDLVNQGDIGVEAVASVGVSVVAHGGEGDALANIAATDSNLSVTASAFAVGLTVSAATITGDFENSGDIDVLANAGIVVAVSAYAADGGATAYISSSSSMGFTADATATGLLATLTNLDGSFTNAGDIVATAVASIEIDVAAHAGNGTAVAHILAPDTSLSITASASAIGLEVDIIDVDGNVSNSGYVGADAIASIDISVVADATSGDAHAFFVASASSLSVTATAVATGISVSITTLDGDLTNSGGVDALANAAVVVAVSANAAFGDATAYILASDINISATATAYGLYATLTTLGGAFDNSGNLDVTAAASVDVSVAAHAPNETPKAYIKATETSLFLFAAASAYGLFAEINTVGGDFANSGDIGVDAIATVGASVVATDGGEGAVAFISASSAASFTISAVAFAVGLTASITTVSGNFANSGDIDVLAHAGVVVAVSAYAEGGAATAYIWSYESMEFTASATATGLIADITNVDGDFTNSGDVEAVAIADVVIDVAAHAAAGGATAYISTTDTSLDISASASAIGLVADIVSLGGSFNNSGYVGADAIALVDVSVLAESADGDALAHIGATGTTLSISASASATGLSVSITTLSGDLINSGGVDALANASVILDVSAIGGDDATAYISASSISISASASAIGADLSITNLGGSFDNSGDIAATAVAAIDVSVSAEAGGEAALAYISSTSESIDISASASATGLLVDIATVGGNVSNSGQVEANAIASIDVSVVADATASFNAEAYIVAATSLSITANASVTGLSVSITTLDGDLTNSGGIDALAHAAVVVAVSAYAGNGNALAHISATDIAISATATAYGLYATLTTLGGAFDNSGDIVATAAASVDVSVAAHSLFGAATAYLKATSSSLYLVATASAYGLFAEINTVGGDFANSGDIAADAIATVGASVVADGGEGGVLAYISASDTANLSIYASASAVGLSALITTVSGNFANGGNIDVLAHAGVVLAVSADAGAGSATAYIFSFESLFITATASATGLIGDITNVDGDFTNSGDIEAAAVADVTIDVVAHAIGGDADAYISTTDTQFDISASASALGLEADIVSLDGSFNNSGYVGADAIALVDMSVVADASDGSAYAHLNATGTTLSISASASATGISVSITTLSGDLINSGGVDALAHASVIVALSADATNGDAVAFITASSISVSASASAIGVDVSITTLGGAFDNSGDIAATAVAAIDLSLAAHAVSGNATAYISATDGSISISASATATGLQVDINTVGTDFTNSGDIDATAVATIDVAIAASAPDGSATAYLSVADDALFVTASASASGIDVGITSVAGDFANTGDIDVAAHAAVVMALSADAGSGAAVASLYANSTIYILASAVATGIFASINTVGGDFSNSGDISVAAIGTVDIMLAATAASGNATAKLVSFSSEISIYALAFATGLEVSITAVNGDFTNAGGIDVTAAAGLDISLLADAAGAGNDASAYISASSSVTLYATATAYGLLASITTLDGDFINSGTIGADAIATVNVAVVADATSGNATAFIHSGSSSVSISASASAYGLYALVDTVGGDFTSSGDIDVTAAADVDVSLAAHAGGTGEAKAYVSGTDDIDFSADAQATGAYVSATSIGGDFDNSGDVSVLATAALDVALTATADSGNAFAYLSTTSDDIDISASAEALGVNVTVTSIGGDFDNSGDLDVIASAALLLSLSASATSGAASAYIHAASQSISISASATASGLKADIDTIGGNFSNSGAIDATAIASVDVSLTADVGSGNAQAYMSAPSNGITIEASAFAFGLSATITTVGGDFTNSGDIEAIASAALVVGISAYADVGNASAYITAEESIYLFASAQATGLGAQISSIAGDFSNSGYIGGDAFATVDVTVAAEATSGDAKAFIHSVSGTISIYASATAYGLFADIGTIGGDFTNSGDIDAVASASVDLTLSADAGVNASAYVSTSDDIQFYASATATGAYVSATSIGGSFDNSGDVSVLATAVLDVALTAYADTGNALAYISATSDEIDISADASAFGVSATISTLGGDFLNSGEIDVIASAALLLGLSASATSGDARAFIRATSSISISASARATGLFADIGTIGSDFSNSGDIDANAVASADVSLAAEAGTGDALAYIVATANRVLISAFASADGIDANVTTVGGDFVNSGEVDAIANAALLLSLSAEAGIGDASAYLFAANDVSISAEADAEGIRLEDATVNGQFVNSGELEVFAVASLSAYLSATAATGNANVRIHSNDTVYMLASAYADGITTTGVTLVGGFANSGDITVGAFAHLNVSLTAIASGAEVAFISGSDGTTIKAYAEAYGVRLEAAAIGDDVTNSGDVLALASAYATLTGLDTARTVSATALAVAFFIGTSGTLSGDYVNSGLLAANAHAEINGSALGTAVATAVGLDIQMDVTGNVINSGTIVAQASASSAYAYGIRVVGHSIAGSLQNTGIIAAFATGSVFEEAFAIDVSLASGPTLIEQLDGLIIGDIDLRNAFADTIEFSGGEIFGDLFGDGTDDLLAYAGVDDVLNLSGDIDGFDSINVNFPTATSATAPVELRLGGDVTNTASLNVNAHGTLVVGLTSSINVTTYSQDPDGTTLFEIAPSGVSGQIVPGTANLAGAVGIRPQAGLYADNESYWIIDGGVINGTYDEVLSTALLEVDDEYIGNDVFLNVTRVPFDGLDGMTHNQGSVGGALEEDYGDIIPGTDFADVVGLLFGLSEGEYLDALDDLAGAEHAQMLKIGAGAIRSINNALLGRLAIVRGLTAEQMASVDQVGLAFTQVAATGDVDLHMDLAQAEAQAVAAPGDTGVWARVFGMTSTLDGDDEAPGFDTEGGGASIGIDHRLSPDLVIGIYGGYAHTDADFDSNADGSVDTYQVGAYAGWASGALHVDGLVAGAWQSYELDRTIDFLGRNASSDYDGWGLAASAEAGYDVALGSTAVLEPVVGLDYVHLETNGFTEDGADSVSLAVEDGSYDSLVSTLGVRLTATVDAGGGVSLVPTAMLSWEHEFLEADGAFTARFDGSPGATFEIIGSDDEADAAVLNLGLAVVSENMTAFVAYDGRFTGDATSHQGTIGIRFGF